MEGFWKVGERVVSRFWEPGEPIGTVIGVELVATGELDEPDKDEFLRVQVKEWVKVRFDDGYEREYASFDLRKAPEL